MSDTQRAEIRLLFIACTASDSDAMAWVHASIPFMTSDRRRQLEAILAQREGNNPPDLMHIANIPLEEILGDDLGPEPVYGAAYHAHGVTRRAALNRRLREIPAILKSDAHPTERVTFVLEECEKILGEFGGSGPLIRRVQSVEAMGDEYAEREKSVGGIFLGLGEIDAAIRGIQPGQVMTIGGCSGVGKTALALYIAREVSQRHEVLFVSIEMPAPEIWERIAQSHFVLSHHEISSGVKAGTLDVAEVAEKFKRLRIVDLDTVTLAGLSEFIRNERRQGRAGLVIVDYLQRMDWGRDGEYEGLSRLARGVKSIAKLQQVPIILLSQLSRKVEKQTDPVTLGSMRGSGQIEEAGDYVLGVWLDESIENNPRMLVQGLKLRKAAGGTTIYFKRDMVSMNLWGEFKDEVAPF